MRTIIALLMVLAFVPNIHAASSDTVRITITVLDAKDYVKMGDTYYKKSDVRPDYVSDSVDKDGNSIWRELRDDEEPWLYMWTVGGE